MSRRRELLKSISRKKTDNISAVANDFNAMFLLIIMTMEELFNTEEDLVKSFVEHKLATFLFT